MRLAQFAEVFAQLPGGMEMRVGERGQILSGGERQRLCLARALLRRPRLLIMDESLSAVEEDRADRIVQDLAQWAARPTILFVTHRSQVQKVADRVVDLGANRKTSSGVSKLT